MNWRNIFDRKTVLITGHTGFKGSWLATWLHLLGADVIGYALPPRSGEEHFVTLGLERRIRHIEGDTRDAASLRAVMEETRPEFVFHLAAQPIVSRSYREPKLTFDTNVGGSVNLLEAVRLAGCVRSLVYITSDKCYRNREWDWGYRECDELGGDDPYSASKSCAEIVLAAYQNAFFRESETAAASTRAGNVIGGGDWAPDRIVPDTIRSLRAKQPIRLRNPHAVRPWQHVLEPLSGYLLLAIELYQRRSRDLCGAWNFGPETASHRTVHELVSALVDNWGSGCVETSPSRGDGFHEAQLLCLNCDKARNRLGWKPTWNFTQAVQHTAEWYRRWTGGADAWGLTVSQIESYTAECQIRSQIQDPAGAAA